MKYKDVVLKNFTDILARPENVSKIYSKIYDAYNKGLIKQGCTIGLAQYEIRETKTQFIIEFKGFKGVNKCQTI